RSCRFLSEEGVIEWTWSEKKVRVFTASDGEWRDYAEPQSVVEKGYVAAENMYIDEMRSFIQAVRGDTPFPYTFSEDRTILRILQAAEKSSEDGIHMRTHELSQTLGGSP